MTATDNLEFVSYFIGSFIIGWAIGYLTVYFQKVLDSI